MSAFDATLRVGEASVQLQKENDDAPAYEAQLVLGLLALAPVAPDQALPIPLGTLRCPLNLDAIESLIDSLSRARDQMSRKPNIAIASSLEGVDRAAEFQQGLR